MAALLYEATVRAWLQGLASVQGLIAKATAHCHEFGLAESALTQARLADDMWPLAKQIFECEHHSAGALAGVREGVFRPEFDERTSDLAGLTAHIAQAIAMLDAVDPDEVEGLADEPVRFEIGRRSMPFVAQDFLLSFSMPNFYFHVTTAYAILRAQGLPVGKVDYLGKVRTQPPG